MHPMKALEPVDPLAKSYGPVRFFGSYRSTAFIWSVGSPWSSWSDGFNGSNGCNGSFETNWSIGPGEHIDLFDLTDPMDPLDPIGSLDPQENSAYTGYKSIHVHSKKWHSATDCTSKLLSPNIMLLTSLCTKCSTERFALECLFRCTAIAVSEKSMLVTRSAND